MSLLFNMLSRLVITFLPRSKHLNFMAAVTICSDFGAPKNKVWHCFHCFPIYFHEVMGLDAMIFVFWMLSFKPTFSLSSFTFIKRLFSSSSLSALRVVSVNFQMFKLVLEKAEDPEINFQHPLDHQKSKRVPEKHLFLLYWLPKPLTVWITTNCGKFLEMGIPDHHTCLLRNLYAGQEATVRTRRGTMDWFQIGKGVLQVHILSPCMFNYMQSTSQEMPDWMRHRLKWIFLGEIARTSDI